VIAHWSDALRALRACGESLTWAATQPDAATAWAACERGDWLLWIAARTATNEEQRRAVTLAACAVARTSLRHVPAGEERPRICLEVTEAWARGEATIEQVREARRNAHYATHYAAAYAADAAAYAAYAADAADYAADSAAAAAYSAAAVSLRESADIVRGMLSMPQVAQ
jgi:hypothetical protein